MDEILQYFSQEAGFARLMDGMWETYARHGRCFGAVRIEAPTGEEERAISDFFQRDYFDQALIRVSLAEFERQLHKTFPNAPKLGVLLEAHFARPLTASSATAKERIRIRDSFAVHVKNEILPAYERTPAAEWLNEMIAHMRRNYKPWAERFITEKDAVVAQTKVVCDALNALNDDAYVLLSEFSQEVCGDPHALDFYGTHGPLFLRALAKRYKMNVPAQLEESIHLYWQACLLSNGVLNQVTVLGLQAFVEDEDEACAYYNNLNEAHILTLENISRFTRVEAVKKKVFVVENASVFALLCERLRGINCSVVCAAAGMNAALDRLLFLCGDNGAKIYYSGNMDVRGLTWGDMLYLRLYKNFIPWRYSKEDYERALVTSEAMLPDEKKEVSLHNEEFAALLSLIRKKGKIATQMPLVDLLAADIKKLVGGKHGK